MKIFKTKKYSILSNLLKYSFVILFVFMLIIPVLFVRAETCADGTIKTVCPDVGVSNKPDVGSSNTNVTTKIVNPLGENGPQDIPDFIKLVIKIVLEVGIPIVALAIIYTGFLFVAAQGSPEKLTKAKKALLYTLIGATLLLGAFVIANAIGKTVDEIKKSA